MEKIFKEVETILNRLQDLHKIHMASFEQDVLPDLERQSEDRAIEIGLLIKNVDQLVKRANKQTCEGTNTKSMMIDLNDRVTRLLEQNKALETKVSAFLNQLKKKMNQVSKGKNAISSYRSSTAFSNKPRVISITNY